MNVFGYVRVSTAHQRDEGYSVDEQQERISAYCKGMGWNLLKVYIDAAESGAKSDRPALNEMVRNIKKVDKVVVYKLDRLSRSQKDTLYLIEDVFLKNGVDFVSMTENFDTATPFGKAIVGILAVFAQLEREQIKERMEMGRLARCKEGKYVGQSRTAIGYRYANGELTPDDDAEQVRLVYELCLQGLGYNEIAQEMIKRGYAHRYGMWERTTVRMCLRNPIYIGKVAFGGEYFQGNHDPIIDQLVWEQAQSLCERRTQIYGFQHKPGKATSYLAGMLYCEHCGSRYYKRTDSHCTPVYVCQGRTLGKGCQNKRWKMAELDEIVFGQIKSLKLEPVKSQKPKDNTAELLKIDQQMARLLDLYVLGSFDIEELNKRTAALNARRQSLESAKAPDYQRVIDSFGDLLEHANFKSIRSVLFQLISRIELDGENVSIFWTFS